MEGKTNTRVAMALLCGLAICCAVMYVTADGESIHEAAPAESVYGIGGPTSVSSEDVEKAGTVITNTPDGRMRLTDYLTNVEKEISAEQAARKRDVQAVREQMARNFAFNAAARKKMKKLLLAKMAVNAKKAKDDLATSMRHVQQQFADTAALQNKRNKANIARSKALRATIRKNKKLAKQNLQKQVLTQQRAMAALASATNERIKQTDAHVAKNAAQIKTNAKKAKDELDAAVNKFDKKVADARDEAAAGRGKLSQQLADQDKAMRQWANNKLKRVMAKTAAQFAKVRAKMAEDRHNADMALKQAASRMDASLNAKEALDNKNFAKTVSDIAAAKKEAEDRVQAAEANFKVGINSLASTVKSQVQKTNARMDALSSTIDKNKVAQAKINANVNAEMKRMVKLGNARYSEHLKKDAELKGMIDANKAATDKRMKAMGAHYKAEISAVQATMKKNRAHASHMLAKKSAELYSAIAKNEKAQMDTNGKLKASQERASLDVQNALHEAKNDFAQRLGALTTTVHKNDEKFEGKIHKLTGIVDANAMKSAQGRKNLQTMMDANKRELEAAVRDAVSKGEKRMQAAEEKLVTQNAETKANLNMKISAEISKLQKEANSQIEGLRNSSKKARAEMRAFLLEAVREMAKEAKENLDGAVTVATAAFAAQNAQETAASAAAAADRAQIGLKIQLQKEKTRREIKSAADQMESALAALAVETRKEIAKTDKRVDAYAAALDKEADDVAALMKAQKDELMGKIEAQKQAASAATTAADASSAAGFAGVMKEVESELESAADAASAKFDKLYKDMAGQRKELDDKLAGEVDVMNDAIAKQAALADSRFSKTVKDIKAARTEASSAVSDARADFATGLLEVTSLIKAMETTQLENVQKVSGALISHKAVQSRVNAQVTEEIGRIKELMNHQHSTSTKARGKLRDILDENKQAAADATNELADLFEKKIKKIRSKAHQDVEDAKLDLTQETEKMYEKMADVATTNAYNNEVSAEAIAKYETDMNTAVNSVKDDFTAQMDTLGNTIAANHKSVERNFEILTGVVRDAKTAGEEDRARIRAQNEVLNTDMKKAIQTAINIGETKAKAVALRARENLAAEKKSLLSEITHTVEEMADTAFKVIQGHHGKIADNYLSLKAYAVSAEDAITKYVGHGKGKNLSSLGDLLTNVAGMSDVVVTKAEGLSPSGTLKAIFTGGEIKVDGTVSKVNGLVNEYVDACNGVRQRWPLGLGKYLLQKLEQSMMKKGVLQVDKIDGKAGNYVFMNGHAVGLSNKLNDFEGLAVRMGTYEATLAKLTASLTGKVHPAAGKPHPFYASAPQWDGK